MVLPCERIRFEDGKAVLGNEIGTAIFYREKLGAGLIAHEMGHCAFWYDRLINGNTNAEYGPEVGEAEERVLDLLYDFTRNFINKCYKTGIYP